MPDTSTPKFISEPIYDMVPKGTIEQLKATIEILWRTLNRDQKAWADESLQEQGLPEVESGYRYVKPTEAR